MEIDIIESWYDSHDNTLNFDCPACDNMIIAEDASNIDTTLVTECTKCKHTFEIIRSYPEICEFEVMPVPSGKEAI